jgi:hypothetical protein
MNKNLSLLKVFGHFAIFSILLVGANSAYGQDAIRKNIERFQAAGKEFEKTAPFKSATAKGSESLRSLGVEETALLDGTAFFLKENDGKSLKSDLGKFVKMELPSEDGSLEVLLYEQTIFTDDATITTSESGEMNLPLPEAKFYRGIVKGEEHSLVAITVFDDEINGLVSFGPETYVLGKINDSKSNAHIWYRDEDLLLDETFSCEAIASDDHEESPKYGNHGSPKTVKCVRMRIEIDNDIVSDFGGSTGATNYVTALFNQVITLFANDDIDVAVGEIFAWSGSSPYSGDLGDRLGQLNNNSSNADLTTLLTGAGGGGIAYLSGVCSSNFGVSVSGIFGFFNNVPSYSWDVNVVAHEIGHNLSSPHTHACSWNGNNTAIDGCGATAGYSEGCSGPIPSGGGTIMSYCHLLSTGVNFNLGFGPQPTSRMTNYINSRSCLGTSCVSEPEVCEDESLTLTIDLDEYPAETTWEIYSGSTVVASGGSYGQSFTTVTEDICLPEGCYTMTFFDSYGDGICCGFGDGSYTLTDESGSVLASGGEFEDSETTSFCAGATTEPCFDVNFNDYTLYSYIPSRDEGTYTIQEAGSGIFLSDNSLKLIPIGYDVTPNTKISFEFQSTDQGSIHAIAMENNTSLSLNKLFQLHGTLNNPNVISDFNNYSGTSLQSYVIDVGNYYTGNDLHLVVLSANVNGSPGNNSYFRNVRLYEGTDCGGAAAPQAMSSVAAEGEFALFPNPTKDNVTLVSSSNVDIQTIRVFSLTGALIDEVVVNGPRATMEFSQKAPGIYLIQWMDSNGTSHQERLVKTQ